MGNNSCDFDARFHPVIAITNRKGIQSIIAYPVLYVYTGPKYCLWNVFAGRIVNVKGCDKTRYSKTGLQANLDSIERLAFGLTADLYLVCCVQPELEHLTPSQEIAIGEGKGNARADEII